MTSRPTGSTRRPRILFLACHLPWPVTSGGRRREWELIRRLGDRFDIHLLVVSKTYQEDLSSRDRLDPHCARVDVLAADSPAEVRQLERHRCAEASGRVRRLLARQRFDVVHAEGFYLMQHLPCPLAVPTLLVEQNIEYELARQRVAVRDGRATDLEAFSSFLRTRAAEVACWRRATRLGALTPEDREIMLTTRPSGEVALLPDGADHLPLAPGRAVADPPRVRATAAALPPGRPTISFVANFGYAPNVDGARHFCRAILPAIVAEEPRVLVRLVGNAPPPEVIALAGEHVMVTGPVPDVVPYLDAAQVVICPLRIGGGIKVKTIEALRRGKALVSTAIGVQGLPPRARRAVMVADSAQEFSAAVLRLLRDPARRRRQERQAAAAAAQLPTWDDAARALARVYLELAETGSHERPLRIPAFAGRPA